MEHIAQEHTQPCSQQPGCWSCDGGLFICKVCWLLEGALTTECPGVPSYIQYGDAVYKGEIDFVDEEWKPGVMSRHSPAFSHNLQEKLMKECKGIKMETVVYEDRTRETKPLLSAWPQTDKKRLTGYTSMEHIDDCCPKARED